MKHAFTRMLVVLAILRLPQLGGAEPRAVSPKASFEASGAVRVGVVWEDNPLLSSQNPEKGPAIFGSLEGLAWKGLPKKASLSGFLSGERRHRVGNLRDLADSEFWFGEVGLAHKTLEIWENKVRVRALSQTEVMDFSDTSAFRVVLPVTNRAGTVVLNELIRGPKGFEIKVEGERTRSLFKGYRRDFNETKGRASIVWKRARFESECGAELASRHYDYRTHYSLSGRPLAGNLLETSKVRYFVQGRFRPVGEHGWGMVAKAFSQETEDHGTGFFDTRREGGSLGVSRALGPWTFKVEGGAEQESYRQQTVGTGIHPQKRRSRLWQGELSVEREFSVHWSVIGEVGIQKMDANSAEYRYRTVTVSVALERRF